MKSHDGLTIHAGSLEQPFSSALVRAREERFIERLFEHDADVFGKSGEALASIQNRLGWLTIASEMKPRLAELETFATEVMNDGIKHVLVLGMGGSSLAPELISLIFGPRAGLLSVGALDTTDPAAIRTTLEAHDISQTLFIVASKSGRTVETLSHARFFFDLVQKTDVGVPGSRFVAITDKGSDLEAMASERSFRHTFINPADIGGRYSALSYFGLVPAVFTGAKIERLVESAVTAENACSRTDIENNSAFRLGALWAVGADRGIDKLTFVTGGSLEPFVPWVEQLVAESTGKEGNGVIPIEGEPTGEFADYGEDRLFVFMSLKGESSAEKDDLERAAIASGAPCVSIQMERLEDLGFEFLRQEVATATAGYIMGINPFDEPNVSESKNNTATILKDFEETGSFPHPKIITAWDGLEVAELGDASTYDESELDSASRSLKRFFTSLRKGSYVAILNYVERTDETERSLALLRRTIRDKFGVATLRGYGPRFLHSIGQLYKGGAAQGQFIIMTHSEQERIDIPGAVYSFNLLIAAQAIGDTSALVKRNLPTLMINCATDPATDLVSLATQIDKRFKDLRASSGRNTREAHSSVS